MEENNYVAIYLDFENLAISAHEVYKGVRLPMQIAPIMRYAQEKGKIRIKKAYADWSKKKFSQYQSLLIAEGFELIHLPETNRQGKNGSDMRLVIDVMDQVYSHPQVDTLVIGSGDSDFIPLTQHLIRKEKQVIVIGFDHSVSAMVKNYCTEFKSIESIIGKPEVHNGRRSRLSDPGRKLLVAFLEKHKPEGPVSLAKVKAGIRKLDPKFEEKSEGYSSFKKFIKFWKGDLVDRVEKVNGRASVYFLPVGKGRVQRKPVPQKKPNGRTKPVDRKDTQAYAKARTVVLQFLREREGNAPIALTRLKQQLLKLDPSFSEREAGFRYFKHFVQALEGDLVEKMELRGRTSYVHFREMQPPVAVTKELTVAETKAKAENGKSTPDSRKQARDQKRPEKPRNGQKPQKQTAAAKGPKKPANKVNPGSEPAKKSGVSDKTRAKTLLVKELQYNKNLEERLSMANALIEGFRTYPKMTLDQMKTYVRERSNLEAKDLVFRKYVFTLKHAGVFETEGQGRGQNGKKFSLKKEIDRAEKLDGFYIEQVSKVLKDRFGRLDNQAILEVLF